MAERSDFLKTDSWSFQLSTDVLQKTKTKNLNPTQFHQNPKNNQQHLPQSSLSSHPLQSGGSRARTRNSSSCVMAIRTLVARCGVPGVIWSDNGTNFIAIEKKLVNNVQNWNQQTLIDSLVKESLKKKFNPPSAPHHGGLWEQLVRSLNHTFYAILGNRRLTQKFLSTNFCIVEHSLNVRLLVAASADATEIDALTPNHFLLEPAGSSSPPLANCDIDHRKRYARADAYSDAIWSRWRKEYVALLNSGTKWLSPFNRDFQTADLVWIVEPKNPRGYYLLPPVVKTNFGSDAIARSAEVRKASGNLIRPVVKLAIVFLVTDSDFKKPCL